MYRCSLPCREAIWSHDIQAFDIAAPLLIRFRRRGSVIRRSVLGGIINDCYRQAA